MGQCIISSRGGISESFKEGAGIDITEKTISIKVDNDTITLNQEGQLTAALPDISRNAVFNAELSSNGWDIADLVGKIQETGISTAINTIAAGKGDAWVAAGNDIWYCRDNTFKIWEKAITNMPSDIPFPTINEVTYISELGLFIAVGYEGSILLSNNASNWMVIYMDGSDKDTVLTSAAYGNGTFVVVGENGVVLTSNNGLEWKDHSLPEELKSNLNSVVYSNNKFKIVTAIGAILSSQDGENWTSDTFPSTLNSINDVAYGNDKFVAVGNRGQILTCPSTSNAWSLQDIATEENFLAVACCDDLSVAVGGHGTIFVNNGTSNDWKKIDHDSTRSFTDVVYDEKNELFIISGSSQEVVIAKAILQQTVATTPEGLTAEDVVVAGVVATDLESTHELLEWNKINLIDTGDNQITAQCGVNPPKTDLKIQLKL